MFHSKVGKFIRRYFYNILFYSFALGILYFNFWLFFNIVERQIDTDIPSSVFLHLTTCLFLSLPYFLAKKRKDILIYVLIFINLYLISNLLYYRTYFTILPIDSYTMLGNLRNLFDSIFSAFHLVDLFFVIPTIFISLLYYYLFRKKIVIESIKARTIFSGVIIIIILSTISINLLIERNEVSNLLSDENEFKYDVVDGASTYGFLHCWIWQFKALIEQNKKLTNVEEKKINQWLKRHKEDESFNFKVNTTKKNVILIIVESLESFPIGKKLNGKEITPELNKLIKSNNCFYAPNIIPQVNIGHSSDTQLMFNTGMLPPHTGAACFRYQHNTYYSLAKALKKEGYNTHTLLGGNGSFWNQGVMNQTLGYDDLTTIDQYRQDEYYDFGLTDSTFLSQSVEKISHFKSPFLAQLITLSSHDPYKLINNRIYFTAPKDCPPEMGKYLNSIYYVDKCLGMFMDSLKNSGLLEKSIVIISGDHDATKQQKKLWQNYAQKEWKCQISRTPLLIINGPAKKLDTTVTGQIDVYPTLIDILGLKNYFWHGLGQSMLNNKSEYAINAHFEEFGDKKKISKFEIQQKKDAWEISDLMIRKNYFKKMK